MSYYDFDGHFWLPEEVCGKAKQVVNDSQDLGRKTFMSRLKNLVLNKKAEIKENN